MKDRFKLCFVGTILSILYLSKFLFYLIKEPYIIFEIAATILGCFGMHFVWKLAYWLVKGQ